MEGLESCVQTLDMRSIPPHLLDQVSESCENEASRHFSISLYAELARVHKQAVIPFIPRMMASIVRSLPFSADSQQLHEACAKVITSVARHTIDPTRPYDSNQEILVDLCSPLLPVLSSKLESSAAGAAICLQALVESEKWKFAHIDLQDLICVKATAALAEQGTHAVAFLHLLKSLAKFCVDASKKHVAEWLGVGLQVLQADSALWQRRLAAAQLITIILKTTDADKLGLDLPHIIKTLESCLLDKVTVVQAAVTQAFEAARGLALEKHLLCTGRHDYSTPGSKTGSVDFSCESRGQVSDAEESSTQELSNSISPRSGASSLEAVPSMASSTGNFSVDRKRSKQREKNASYLSHFSGNLTRTSVLKENTPATIPRRVLSEIPASGKRFSNSDFIPSSWEGKSLRRASVDLGIKAASYSMQNQAPLGPRKYSQHVPAPIHDGKKTASLEKKHVDGCQNISYIECTCIANLEKKESISHVNVAGGQNNINSNNCKSLEELDERAKESEKVLSGGSVPTKECLLGERKAIESDGDVGCADDGPLSKDTSMETRSRDSRSSEKGSHLKGASSCNPPQDFAFRAPGSLLHSLQGEMSAKDRKQSCKECSDCENRRPRGASCTSDSFASGDSEEEQIVSVNFQSRNVASCGRSEDSDRSTNQKYKLRSCTDRHSIQSTSESACRLSSVPADDSEISASGRDWPSSRESSDREADYNVKIGHSHTKTNLHKSSKESSSQRCQAEGHPELLGKPGIRSREVKDSDSGSRVTWIRKEQVCAGAALGLFCAVGMLILAIMVIQHVDKSYGLHALVPT